jgi:type II secretory pathway component PulF
MGSLVKQTILTEFTRTMSLLLSAGVSVVEALRIVSDSVGNSVVQRDVKRIANQVEKGFPVSISFTESDFFPPIIGQMAAVGEETGKMDEVLAKISTYFESESEQKVKGLTTAIEPIILMVMAVGVGFLMYAIIMPIYEITNKV